MSEPAIVIRDLTKSYGEIRALRGISLEIPRGEIFAALGPNGAGKTTCIEILEGHRRRSGGEVRVLGVDPEKGRGAWRAQLGIVLQSTAVFEALTVEEVVTEFASFYPAPMQLDHAIRMVGLEAQRRVRCANLSGGQKRRVELALGVVGDPELIFLDEPTTGLDPEGRRQLWEVVRSFAALGKTIVLTTHYLDEAEALADRVGIIIDGQMAALGAPHEIGGRDRALARVSFDSDGVGENDFPPLPGTVLVDERHVVITTDRPTEVIRALQPWLAARGLSELPRLAVAQPSLEDVYLSLIAERRAGDGASQS